MKYIWFIIVYMPFCSILNSQNKGDLQRNRGNLQSAINSYKKDLSLKKEDYTLNYNLACIYAIMYKKDSAFHYLKKALKTNNSLWALADNDLFSLTSDIRWKSIENQQIEKFQNHNHKLKNPKYAIELLRLIMKDQALDYQLDMAKRFYVDNNTAPHWYYPIAAMKKEITKNNFNKMEALIKKYGWPTYSKVGKIAADGPLLVINHHAKDSIRIKYISKIKEACLNKDGSCIEYAKIQDRILVNSGKPQLYGMQFKYDSSRNLIPFPIYKPHLVDKRRKKIGLKSLKQYLKKKINYNFNTIQE